MTFESLISLVATFFCGGLAAFVLMRDPKTLANTALVASMTLIAVAQLFAAFGGASPLSSEVLFWKRFELLARSVVPGAWFVFSLTFARSNAREYVARRRWLVAAAFAGPLAMVTLFQSSFFEVAPEVDQALGALVPLGASGKAFYVAVLLISVGVLASLEATLRATWGGKRWRVKFLVVGVGSYFAAQVYLATQALLYSSIDLFLEPVQAWAAILAAAFVAVYLVRTREALPEIYLSPSVVYNSLTVVLVGVYLLAVGIVAQLISTFGGAAALSLTILAVLLLLVALALLLLSDRARESLRRFVMQNFYAAGYDYRKEWTGFTRGTVSIVDPKELCAAVVRIVSETFGADSVTIWRIEEPGGQVVFGGSTAISENQVRHDRGLQESGERLTRYLQGGEDIIDFAAPVEPSIRELARANERLFRLARIRLAVPLVASRKSVGVMTVGDRITHRSFDLEDFDLLRTIADQAAATLLNLHLSDEVARAKEMHVFQTLSSFFVHDLKNLASMLSLTVQNLPKNYDNPDFRRDALKVISESVEKMNAMCSRLSLLGRKADLDRHEIDLNDLVRETLGRVNGSLHVPVEAALQPIPRVSVDSEQIEKVLLNLVLNADDAIEGSGTIRVATAAREGWLVLTVSDTGRGMSEEFMARKLFLPFQTTKSKGLGIGLFQSKRLVEAHGGRIEVDSDEGRGSSFRVLLPLAPGSGLTSGVSRLATSGPANP